MNLTNEQIEKILEVAPANDWTHYCTRNEQYFKRDGDTNRLFLWSNHTEVWSVPLVVKPRWLEHRERLEEILALRQRVEELESQLKEREPKRWFTYCDNDGYVEHETEDKAKQYGDAIIQTWLHHCWDEGVAGVRMGVVTHAATEGERTYPEGKINEEGCDEAGVWWNADWDYQVDWSLDDVSITIEGERQ